MESCLLFPYSSCGGLLLLLLLYAEYVKGLLDKFLDPSALLKWQFWGGDTSRGLEAVKVDAERDNETFWQREPLPLTPPTSVQLCRMHEHTVAKVKRATGITEKNCFSAAADTNEVQFATQTPLTQQDTFFFLCR